MILISPLTVLSLVNERVEELSLVKETEICGNLPMGNEPFYCD